MHPVASFHSAQDLYAKLQRDATAVNREVSSDALFNFVITGYSLIDWVKNDPATPKLAKAHSEIDALHANRWLKVCGDIATASKHFAITHRTPITSSVTSQQGFGAGRFGAGPYGVGEEGITVSLNDGTQFSALDLVAGVLGAWQAFFARHGYAS